jgi:hypothetical protein
MGQIVGPEMLVFNLNQTPDNYPKEDNFSKPLLVFLSFGRQVPE